MKRFQIFCFCLVALILVVGVAFWRFGHGSDAEIRLQQEPLSGEPPARNPDVNVVSRSVEAPGRQAVGGPSKQDFDVVVRVIDSQGALLPSQIYASAPRSLGPIPLEKVGRGLFRVSTSQENLSIVATRLDTGEVRAVEFVLQSGREECEIEFQATKQVALRLTILGPMGNRFSGSAQLATLDYFEGADRGFRLRRSKGSWRGQGLEPSLAKDLATKEVAVLDGDLVILRNSSSSTFLRLESEQGLCAVWIPPGKAAQSVFLRSEVKSKFEVTLNGKHPKSGKLELIVGDLHSDLWCGQVVEGRATLREVPGSFGATFVFRDELGKTVAALPIASPLLIKSFQREIQQRELIKLRFHTFEEADWKIVQRDRIDRVYKNWDLVVSVRSPNSVRIEVASFRSDGFGSSITLPLSEGGDSFEFGLRLGDNYIPIEGTEERTIDLGNVYSVSGRVVDQNGEPVPYAEVGFADDFSRINKLHVYQDLSVRTSAKGYFSLLLGAASYRMLVRSTEFTDYEEQITVDEDVTLKPCALTESARLRGRLLGDSVADVTVVTVVPSRIRIMAIQTSPVIDGEFEFRPKTSGSWFSINLRDKLGTEFGLSGQFRRDQVTLLNVPGHFRHTLQILGRPCGNRIECSWRSVNIHGNYFASDKGVFELSVPKANVAGRIRMLVDRKWVVVWEGRSTNIPDQITLERNNQEINLRFFGGPQEVDLSVSSSASLGEAISFSMKTGSPKSVRLNLSKNDMVVVRVNRGLPYYFAPEDRMFNCGDVGDYEIVITPAVAKWMVENEGSALAVFQDQDHQVGGTRPRILPGPSTLGLLFPRELAATVFTRKGTQVSHRLGVSVDMTNKQISLDFD